MFYLLLNDYILTLIIGLYSTMKSSDEFTSPASFLKKQSHIITNNNPNPDFYPNTPTTRYLLYKYLYIGKNKCIVAIFIVRQTLINSYRVLHTSMNQILRSTRPKKRKVMRMGVLRITAHMKCHSILSIRFISQKMCLRSSREAGLVRKRSLGSAATTSRIILLRKWIVTKVMVSFYL